MRRHGLDDGFILTDGGCLIKTNLRIALTQFIEENRNIPLQVATLSNEHRYDDDSFEPIGDQQFGASPQIWRHELKKRRFNAQSG